MAQTICQGVKQGLVLEFTYDGYNRIVEPHCHGYSSKGNESLRAFQVAGGSKSGKVPSWKLFTVSKIGAVTKTGDRFSGTRPGYNPQDSAMDRIHCNR
jgi:hypothetical protein